MKKEKITLCAIKKDLTAAIRDRLFCVSDWRFSYIVPITLLAVLLGVYLKNIFVFALVFSVSAYHIVRYAFDLKKHGANKRAVASLIERGEISVSREVFSHISHDTVYEPHSVGGRAKSGKTVTVYHFIGGASYRLPNVHRHYSWSEELYLSAKGLENMSIAGDAFFFVRLQSRPDIAYIYPCKIFELDADLKKNGGL